MSSHGIKVSVVIPVRNGMPYICSTIESVYSQLGANNELIIHENFSTDGTREALLQYSHLQNVRIIEADKPLSAAQNWSKAVSFAKGQYVKILCADDYIMPETIEKQSKNLDANPKCVMVSNKRVIINQDGDVIFAKRGLKGLVGTFSGNQAVEIAVASGSNPFGETSAVMYRTDVLLNELPFTESFPYLTDLEMHVRVLGHGDFCGSGEVLSSFRVHDNSWSNSLVRNQYKQHINWLQEQKSFQNFSSVKKIFVLFRVFINAQLRKLIFLKRRNTKI